jgi:CelD/BcsL family acetyltransferase involved in cellulose biosynthesis
VLCFCRDGIATYDFVGFEPSAQVLSPGTVLQYLMLESMFAERKIGIFDFTEGEGPQKEYFATEHLRCAKTYVLHATLANWLAIIAHSSLDAISALTGRVLERWRLKSLVKTWLRRRA